MPAYNYWLQLPSKNQNHQFQRWYQDLKETESIVNMFLNIIRGSCESRKITAESGFYHEALQSSPSCQLLRVSVNTALNLYPEISAGKHRFTIRFLQFHLEKQIQTESSIELSLCCCGI